MGRQWLLAKRLVTGLKKSKTNTKAVREISIAAKLGGNDPVCATLSPLTAETICGEFSPASIQRSSPKLVSMRVMEAS